MSGWNPWAETNKQTDTDRDRERTLLRQCLVWNPWAWASMIMEPCIILTLDFINILVYDNRLVVETVSGLEPLGMGLDDHGTMHYPYIGLH